MNLKALLMGLSLFAFANAPAMAITSHGGGHVAIHSTAVPFFCEEGNGNDFFDEGFSRFDHGVYQGGVFNWDEDDEIGFRIDTGGATSFSFDTTSTGAADPSVSYRYTTNGSNLFSDQSGVFATTNSRGVTHWSWNIRNSDVPFGARVVLIYFADFGDGNFTDTASHALVNGLGVGVNPHLQSDCFDD